MQNYLFEAFFSLFNTFQLKLKSVNDFGLSVCLSVCPSVRPITSVINTFQLKLKSVNDFGLSVCLFVCPSAR